MILGLDVHANYGRIDWARVRAAGVRFVIAKCTEGNNDKPDTVWNEGKDSRFDEYIAGARSAGLYVGAYLFAYPLPSGPKLPPGRSPVEQARKFYADSRALGTGYGELPPALDLEWPPVRKPLETGGYEESWERWKVTPASISAWGRECAEELTRLYGRKPLLYTYQWYVDTLRKGISYTNASGQSYSYAGTDVSWMADYQLWIPSANALQDWMPVGKQPLVPKPWKDWTLWQFGFDGSRVAVPGVPAVPLDRNVFNGDLNALRQLANIDPDADTLPELDDTQPVTVPSMRPSPFDAQIIHPDVPLGRPALDDDDEPPPEAA